MTAGFEAWISVIDSVGTLGLVVILAWAFYTRRIRLGSDADRCEMERDTLREEVKQLWVEKAEDARESSDLARAYLKLREQER